MSMSHKAYVFDWQSFHGELAPLLMRSLTVNDVGRLIEFGNANLPMLTDPYEGEPLADGWTSDLEAADVQEVADYVLTKFYDPADDRGIGDVWRTAEATLSKQQSAALLGKPFGPASNPFDPGRMGSYFQDEAMCRTALGIFTTIDRPEFMTFLNVLQEAVRSGKGVYVTF